VLVKSREVLVKTRVVVFGASEIAARALRAACRDVPGVELDLVDNEERAHEAVLDRAHPVDVVLIDAVENAPRVAKTSLTRDPRTLVHPMGPIESEGAARVLLEAVHASAQARRARQELLLSIVAHDVRAPLGVALGSLSEMSHPTVGDLNPEQRMLLRLVRRGLDRLTKLSTNLSQLARIDARRLALCRAPADVAVVAREAAERTAREDDERTTRVEFDTASVPADIDREKIACAVDNLVTNALRHAKSRVLVSVTRAGDDAMISVEDDGHGLPPDVPDVFDRLGAIEGRTGKTGSGLGLAVVRGLVLAHGGTATAENIVDDGAVRGARFVVRLPALARDAGRAAERAT
jgi:two-component system, OmpR family, sensor kinase